jgi:ferredoxin
MAALDSRFCGNDEINAAMKVRIEFPPCNSCGLCREVCPESAIRPMLLEPRHLYEVQEAKCTGCGECLDYCPAPGALVQYDAASLAPLAGRGLG